jgi:NTE family protein
MRLATTTATATTTSGQPDAALVLGAGGPVGHAFHAGALRALRDGAGWEAAEVELLVGTSAGAQVGALLRAGFGARDLHARIAGGPLSGAAAAIARHLPPPDATAARGSAPRRWPASLSYLRRALARPWRARLGPLVAALLPEGGTDAAPLCAGLGRVHGTRWPDRTLWITAVRADTGARVVFGRPEAPPVDVATALRCSSAVPGLRRPERVAGARYLDGGIASPTHLDLLDEPGRPPPPLVVVSSPLSRFAPLALLVRLEARRLARRGVRVVLLEPDGEVAAAMGWNPLDARGARRVAEAAYRSTLARVASGRLVLAANAAHSASASS